MGFGFIGIFCAPTSCILPSVLHLALKLNLEYTIIVVFIFWVFWNGSHVIKYTYSVLCAYVNIYLYIYIYIFNSAKNRPPMYSEVGALSQMPFFVFVFCLGGGFKPEKMF